MGDPNFIPAAVAVYPFRVGQTPQNEKIALLKKDTNLIVNKTDGDPLFKTDGLPSDTLKQYLSLLSQIENSNRIVEKACSLMDSFDLFEPFVLKIPGTGGVGEITGLSVWSVQKFNSLEEKEFLARENFMHLIFIYAHFCSLSCLRAHGQLDENQRKFSWEICKRLGI